MQKLITPRSIDLASNWVEEKVFVAEFEDWCFMLLFLKKKLHILCQMKQVQAYFLTLFGN